MLTPTEQHVRRDDRRDLAQRPVAQAVRSGGKFRRVVIGEPEPPLSRCRRKSRFRSIRYVGISRSWQSSVLVTVMSNRRRAETSITGGSLHYPPDLTGPTSEAEA